MMIILVVAMLESNLERIPKRIHAKTLSHLARMALLLVFIRKIFISPWWDSGKIKWDLAHFFYEHTMFLYEFFKEGEISLTWTSPPNRASSSPYEHGDATPKTFLLGKSDFNDSLNKEIINATIGSKYVLHFQVDLDLTQSLALQYLPPFPLYFYFFFFLIWVFIIISHFKSRCSSQPESSFLFVSFTPAGIYLFQVNIRNTRTRYEINMFKVNNKNTRTTRMASFWCLYC